MLKPPETKLVESALFSSNFDLLTRILIFYKEQKKHFRERGVVLSLGKSESLRS